MTAILAHVEAVEMENARIWGSNKELAAELERLRAERDEHAHWRRDLADKLHDRETTISAAWEALRSARVHSEATIDDGIRLLSRQLAEADLDAQRYRWLRDNGSDSRVCQKDGYGGYELRWNSALDAAIDAAMGASNE